VIGFHDYSVAPFTNPPLTTVQLDMHGMGIMAAQRLWELIDQPNKRETWFMLAPTQLVVRQSA
jgi:DNA-binding LacI/PurR family transcriptional regulator